MAPLLGSMRDRTSSGVLIRWHYPMPALEIAILHSRFAGDAFDFFSRLVPPYAIWIYSSFQFHTSSICLLYSSCFGLRRVYTSFTSSRPSSFTEHRRSSTDSYNYMSPLTFLVPSTIFVVLWRSATRPASISCSILHSAVSVVVQRLGFICSLYTRTGCFGFGALAHRYAY